MKNARSRILAGGGIMALALAVRCARATTYYWDGFSTDWTSPVSWSTTNSNNPPIISGGVPGSGDTAVFNADGVTGSQYVVLYSGDFTNIPTFVGGLVFNAPVAVSINAGLTNNGGLAIGASGISDSASAAAVTINSLIVSLTANEPWSLASNFTIQGTINLGSFSLNLSSPSSWSFPNQITGGSSGGMFLSGGIISLSGNNTYAGNTIVNGGCFVNVLSPQALGTVGGGTPANGGTTVAANSTINFNGQSTVAEPLSITGTGVNGVGAIINSDVSFNPVNLTGSITITGSASVGGTSPLTLSSNVSSNNGVTVATLTKVGTSTLTLSGTLNNAALAVNISSGTVVLAKSSSGSVHAIGTGGLTIGSGTTAKLAGSGGDQINDAAAVTDNGTFDLNGQSEAIDGLSGSGIITNSIASTNGILVVGVSNASTTFGGTIQNGAGPVIFYKNGNGTLTLTGTNTFSGSLELNNGTLIVGSAQALGATSATTFVNGGTLDLHGQTLGAYSISLGGALANSSATPASLSGSVNGAFGSSIGGSGNMTLSGAFIGSTVYNGSGILTLAGTAGNGEDVTVNSGKLVLAKTSSASVYAVHHLFVFGGTTQLAGTGGFQIDPNGFVNMNNGGTLDLNGQTLNVSNGSFSSGTITNTAAGTTGVFVIPSVNSVFTTLAEGAGKLAVTVNAIGATEIAVSCSYSGPTSISSGTLYFGAQNFAPVLSAFTISAGASFNVAGTNQSIGSLTGAGNLSNLQAGNAVLTVGNDNTSTTFSGAITQSSNALGLNKVGTGTLTLTGNNTSTGPLTASGGTLIIGSTSALGTPSAITILAGATLDLGGAASGNTPLTLQGTLLNSGVIPVSLNGNVNNAASGSATINGLGQITFTGGFNNSGGATTITKTGFNALAFAGAADDTNLSLTVNGGDALLGKTSSGSVHAVGGNLVINGGATVYLAGSGGDQIADSASVQISGTLDIYGHNETVGFLGGGGLVTNSAGTATLTVGGGGMNTGFSGLAQNSSGTLILNKTGAGTASFIGVNGISVAVSDSQGAIDFFSSEHLGGLSISPGALAQIIPVASGPHSIIVTPSLSVAGTLDLTNGYLLVESSAANFAADFASIQAQLIIGHNGTGGGNFWNGTGITSSAATHSGTELTDLAFSSGAAYLAAHGPSATFDGQTVDAYSILVMFTYAGDATLAGNINLDDYLAIDDGFIKHASGYSNGDFNYDGTVDFKDYALIDNAYENQSGTLAEGEISLHAAEFGQPYLDALAGLNATPVPEPASLLMLGAAIGLLAGRRRLGSGRPNR